VGREKDAVRQEEEAARREFLVFRLCLRGDLTFRRSKEYRGGSRGRYWAGEGKFDHGELAARLGIDLKGLFICGWCQGDFSQPKGRTVLEQRERGPKGGKEETKFITLL